MSITQLVVTTTVRVTGTFRDLAGALADPTAAVLTVKAPSGDLITPAVTRASLGIYYADVTLDQPGAWAYEWQGTGALVAAGDGTIYARASAVDG